MKVFGILAMFFLIGCSQGGHSAEEDTLPPRNTPKELQEARLVFQRYGSIFLSEPLKSPKSQSLAKGSWPRWNEDGTWIAFLQGKKVCRVFPETGEVEVLSEGRDPRTLAVPNTGNEIWYSDSGNVMAVDVTTKAVRTVTEGFEPLEMDVVGDEVLGTIKVLGGYRVRIRNVTTGKDHEIGTGCSASFSPDGTQVTRNEKDHVRLALHNKTSTTIDLHLNAPEGRKTDNQFWSNHPDWVLSIDEKSGHIYAHRVSENTVYRITFLGDSDRPDLWVP